MKQIWKLAALGSAMVLAGCSNDSGGNFEDLSLFNRVVFDPAAGQINLPNDLFFAVVQPTTDGTLELPAEVASSSPDLGDPAAALGALDGWSTQQPFLINTQGQEGTTLDPQTVNQAGSIRVFEGAIGGDINEPNCTNLPPLSGCQINRELEYGADFVAQASGNSIQVIPLKPLKESTSYYVVLTDQVQAGGRPLLPALAYQVLRNSSATIDPQSASAQLASIIRSIEQTLTTQTNVNQADIVYSFTFTTQSTTQIIDTVKQSLIAPYAAALGAGASEAQASARLPSLKAAEPALAPTAMEALGLLSAQGVQDQAQLAAQDLPQQQQAVVLSQDYSRLATCQGLTGTLSGQFAAEYGPANDFAVALAGGLFAQVGSFCSASLKTSSVNLPYYSDPAAPLTGRWRAACTNGLTLSRLSADQIEAVTSGGGAGPNNALCQSIGLADLDLSSLGVSDPRYVTRYSPLPVAQGSQQGGTEELVVQISEPDPAVVNLIAANPSSGIQPISRPAAGWPVVILQHGITSKKEDMLALSGALSVAGFATVAIDQPLHGDRGFELNGQTINASSGEGGSVTDFLNLSSLLTTRDNTRQGIVDVVALRLALSASELSEIDETQVSFFGHSLGAITGVGSVAAANRELSSTLSGFSDRYKIQSAVFNAPGGGIAGFLIDSPSFSPLIKGSLLAASSVEFQGFVAGYAAQNSLSLSQAIAPAFTVFIDQVDEATLAQINQTFSQFVFAAQTIIDPADPNNFAELLAGNSSFFIQEVVGGATLPNGQLALPDQVVPNLGTTFPSYAGSEPLARFAGLMAVTNTPTPTGLVRFVLGTHSSVVDPGPAPAVTAQMQRQIATFLTTGSVVVSAPELIQGF